MRARFSVEHVDLVTDLAPSTVIIEGRDVRAMASLMGRVAISVEMHGSQGIAVVAHPNCSGTPATDEEQQENVRRAAEYVSNQIPELDIVGVWIDADDVVSEVCAIGGAA